MYTTVFAVTVSLASFYWGRFIFLISYIWIDTICLTPCLQWRNSLGLTTLDVTSLVMIGKSVCPSCQKQHERMEYICTSEIYLGITLLSASTVDSIYNGYYIVFYRIAPRRATRVRGRHESSGAAPWVLPGNEPARVEELRRTSALSVDAPYERIRRASKVKIYVCLSVCLCQIFAHHFNPYTCIRQHGGYKLYY